MDKTSTLRIWLNNIVHFITLPMRLLNKNPILYKGKNFHIVFFGLFAALEAVVVLLFMSYFWYLKGIRLPDKLIVIFPLLVLIIIACSGMVNMIRYWNKYGKDRKKLLLEAGFNVHGGIIGGIIAGLIASGYIGINAFILFDGAAWGLLLGQFIGRLGCFNYGCCYGYPTKSGFGIAYTNYQSKVLRVHRDLHGIKLHPVQLYTALSNLFGFIIASVLISLNVTGGIVAGGFLVFHGLARILLEFFRYDIYESKRRNWTTFNFSAFSVIAGLLITVERLVHTGVSMQTSLYHSISIKTLIQSINENINFFLPLCLIAFIITFVVYGVRGKKIGTLELRI